MKIEVNRILFKLTNYASGVDFADVKFLIFCTDLNGENLGKVYGNLFTIIQATVWKCFLVTQTFKTKILSVPFHVSNTEVILTLETYPFKLMIQVNLCLGLPV